MWMVNVVSTCSVSGNRSRMVTMVTGSKAAISASRSSCPSMAGIGDKFRMSSVLGVNESLRTATGLPATSTRLLSGANRRSDWLSLIVVAASSTRGSYPCSLIPGLITAIFLENNFCPQSNPPRRNCALIRSSRSITSASL